MISTRPYKIYIANSPRRYAAPTSPSDVGRLQVMTSRLANRRTSNVGHRASSSSQSLSVVSPFPSYHADNMPFALQPFHLNASLPLSCLSQHCSLAIGRCHRSSPIITKPHLAGATLVTASSSRPRKYCIVSAAGYENDISILTMFYSPCRPRIYQYYRRHDLLLHIQFAHHL